MVYFICYSNVVTVGSGVLDTLYNNVIDIISVFLLPLAEQSIQKNLNLSQERAQSVASYLLGCGVSNSQIKSVEGLGQADPIGNNDTAEGRQQNRRVEVYMYASKQMIQQAEAGTLK